MKDETKPMPCPDCGGDAHALETVYRFRVFCELCDLAGPNATNGTGATRAWNLMCKTFVRPGGVESADLGRRAT